MTGLNRMRRSAALSLALACAALAGCSARAPQPATAESARASRAPDVEKHLVGPWWRARDGRTQGLHLRPDGRLELIGVAPLRGLDWRVDGRRLVLRMRAVANDDLYEDVLFLRRLTDRTLVVEADDSWFAGSYKRRRDDALAPPPGDGDRPPRKAAPAPTPAAAPGRPLAQPIVLRRTAVDALAPREAWGAIAEAAAACAQGLNQNLCPRLYADAEQSVLLVEVCRAGGPLGVGVHFVSPEGAVASYPWFDASFGRFACENGCSSADACRYEVTATTPTGRPTEAVYRFDIGPSWGWVRLQFGPGDAVRVLEHRVNRPE